MRSWGLSYCSTYFSFFIVAKDFYRIVDQKPEAAETPEVKPEPAKTKTLETAPDIQENEFISFDQYIPTLYMDQKTGHLMTTYGYPASWGFNGTVFG